MTDFFLEVAPEKNVIISLRLLSITLVPLYICSMKILVHLIFIIPIFLSAQSDSSQFLPHLEVASHRLNTFTNGHYKMSLDSTTLHLTKNNNLADLLQNNTPLSIKAYGTGLSTVSSRGTGSSHTAIVWNGFNIQNALNGLIDLPLSEAGAFDRIGVKFGGGSALFGSGAIGGAIYLDNTIAPKGFHTELSLLSGSYGLMGQSMKISTGNNKMTAAFRLSHQASRNEFIYRNTAEIGQPLKYIQNAAFEKLNLTGSLFFNINKNNLLKINIWESRNDRRIAPTMTAQNDKALLEDAHSRISAEWSFFKNNHITKARAAYFDEDNLYRSTVIDSSRNRVKTAIGEVEHNIEWGNHKALRIGVNGTSNKALTNNFEKEYERKRLAAFSSFNIRLLQTDFSFAVRQELLNSQLIPFTYSLGFQKAILNTENTSKMRWILRGAASRNYNLPSLNDLYWTNLGNPDLKAENGISAELGTDFQIQHNISVSSKWRFTGFLMKTKDWIQWSPNSEGIWKPTNLNTVLSRGLEMFYNWSYTQKDITTNLNINYQLAQSTDLNGYQLLYTPIHSGNATLFLKYKKFYFQYNQTASSRRFSTTDNSTWTRAFTLANSTLGTSFRIKKCELDAHFKVTNIFNTDYQVVAYYPNPRQQMFINLSVKL